MQDEREMIAKLKQRNPEVLAHIFEQQADQLYRLAVSLLHDEQQADGVVQNTFLALINHVDSFEGRANIGTWLYRVAYNDCMRRLRETQRVADMKDEDIDDIMPACFVDWQNVPDEVFQSAEASAEMSRAIAALKPDMRAVFLLRDVEQISTLETAQILDISVEAVKVRLHRARLALRERLAAYFDEWVRA
ncbi:MAG: sigma-70 family RNA polymerase sigma factor [Anaerolineae bacterium]|nr:sigma-70 family RNA polymerase sigma factor [Anaerolineae bacterium]